METLSTNLPEPVLLLLHELRHLQKQITEHLNEIYPGVKITLKASDIILDCKLPNRLILTEYCKRIYVLTPTGLAEYSGISENGEFYVLPIDDEKIRVKFKTPKK